VIGMAVGFPTSADVRTVRARAQEIMQIQGEWVRTPVLVGIGLGDLAWRTVRELPEWLYGPRLHAQAGQLNDEAHAAFQQWTERGGDTLQRIRDRGWVARVIRVIEDTDRRVSACVEHWIDEFHDVSVDLLSAVSLDTRPVATTERRVHYLPLDPEAAGGLAVSPVIAPVDEVPGVRGQTARPAGTTPARRPTTRARPASMSPPPATDSQT
jgi:hypothetical protein